VSLYVSLCTTKSPWPQLLVVLRLKTFDGIKEELTAEGGNKG
jgi:hypothetical protein